MELDRDEARRLERRLETQGRDEWEPVRAGDLLIALLACVWGGLRGACSLIWAGLRAMRRDEPEVLCAWAALLLAAVAWLLGRV